MKQAAGAALRMVAAAVLLAGASRAAAIEEQIQKLLDSSPAARAAFWGIQVVDLTSGKTVYELNPDRLFIPASNVKLFTTATALARLGSDYRFETRVLADAAPDAAGRITGAIRLVGGGDPNLSGRTIPYRMGAETGNPLAGIEQLAEQIVAAGVRRIDGGIVGDDSWYVWQPYAAGWGIEDPATDDGPAVSALTVHDNTVTLTVRPGLREGDPAALYLNPPVEFYRIDNRVRTGPIGSERKIQFERVPGSADVRLWGSIPRRDRGEDFLLGIEEPALYAATALRQALENRGVSVEGPLAVHHLYPDQFADLTKGTAAPAQSGVVLARRVSASLLDDLRITDKVSQNLHAELALRAVGRARRGVGSFEAGLAEVKAFLEEAGIDENSYDLHDGSGLGRTNLVTPSAMVRLLRYMYGLPLREDWIGLLPVAARDGTLSARFGESPAAGRVYAKTGSLSHVSALSGYLRRGAGEWLAFSILVNNYNNKTAEIRGVMDRICNLLLE